MIEQHPNVLAGNQSIWGVHSGSSSTCVPAHLPLPCPSEDGGEKQRGQREAVAHQSRGVPSGIRHILSAMVLAGGSVLRLSHSVFQGSTHRALSLSLSLGKEGKQEKGMRGDIGAIPLMPWAFSSPQGTLFQERGLGVFSDPWRHVGKHKAVGGWAQGSLGGQSPHSSVTSFGTRGHLFRAE